MAQVLSSSGLPPMLFVEKHLIELSRIGYVPQGTFGMVPAKWAADVANDFAETAVLSKRPIGRKEVEAVCLSSASAAEVFFTCMSWGAMHRVHGRAAWQLRQSWLHYIDELRSAPFSRSEAYNRFQLMRTSGALTNIGPAYFTKLIYFCGARNLDAERGFIMDQWTARSIHLLTGRRSIKLIKNYGQDSWRVSDDNPSAVYEAYCGTVLALASELSRLEGRAVTGAEAEERIFSQGWGKGAWRNYLIANEE
ncbi:8-oxoguanine DNA glycosylase OGG fold protein [Microvirga arsenatis]|uniref:Uncharacterized protein n=1 Tax=Microvirga arsenatis TaxID=2692265 RepID=A0ABW9Z5K1_9HYPH|nr:hypothetical protein [Microvirga arsenatis]NBJ13767.1 hypothetical protein [Microvirga arsenatis]NBJ27221.1 hypothetical protein [Microvirga arsenatis]